MYPFGGIPYGPESGAWHARIEFSVDTFPVGWNAPAWLYQRVNPNKVIHVLGWRIHASGILAGIDPTIGQFVTYLYEGGLGLGQPKMDAVPSGLINTCYGQSTETNVFCPGYSSFDGDWILSPAMAGVSAAVLVPMGAPPGAQAADFISQILIWGLEV